MLGLNLGPHCFYPKTLTSPAYGCGFIAVSCPECRAKHGKARAPPPTENAKWEDGIAKAAAASRGSTRFGGSFSFRSLQSGLHLRADG